MESATGALLDLRLPHPRSVREANVAGNAPLWTHQAAFEASPVSASQARAFVTEGLLQHDLAYLVEPVRLVTSELATNAVLHAHTAFDVTLEGMDQVVLLTVRDDSLALPERRAAQSTDWTGRGLEIVEIVSHRWGYRTDASGAKQVWASFALRQPNEF